MPGLLQTPLQPRLPACVILGQDTLRVKTDLLLFLLEMQPNRLRNSVYISLCQPQISSFYFSFLVKGDLAGKVGLSKTKAVHGSGHSDPGYLTIALDQPFPHSSATRRLHFPSTRGCWSGQTSGPRQVPPCFGWESPHR